MCVKALRMQKAFARALLQRTSTNPQRWDTKELQGSQRHTDLLATRIDRSTVALCDTVAVNLVRCPATRVLRGLFLVVVKPTAVPMVGGAS